jgi:hypothetical protein
MQTNIPSRLHFLFDVYILHFWLCFAYVWRHDLYHTLTSQSTALLLASNVKLQNYTYYIWKMIFSIIKQMVHVVEGNIENLYPSKNHYQPRLTSRLTLIFSKWKFSILPSITWTIYIILAFTSCNDFFFFRDLKMNRITKISRTAFSGLVNLRQL